MDEKTGGEILQWALTATREEIVGWFTTNLGPPDYFRDKHYWMWKGTNPIALVSHIDTVHEPADFPPIVYRNKGTVWGADSRGLGADDRCGIASIVCAICEGYSPTVIICDQEETGGVGAKALAEAGEKDPKIYEGISAMIELDRRGSNDAVYYNMDTETEDAKIFRDIIEGPSIGFIKAYGSFSDISKLAPSWKIGAVNLSQGYYNEHMTSEICKFSEWWRNVERVQKIIPLCEELPLIKYESSWSGFDNYSSVSFDKDDDWSWSGPARRGGMRNYDYDSRRKVYVMKTCYCAYLPEKDALCRVCQETLNKDAARDEMCYCGDILGRECCYCTSRRLGSTISQAAEARRKMVNEECYCGDGSCGKCIYCKNVTEEEELEEEIYDTVTASTSGEVYKIIDPQSGMCYYTPRSTAIKMYQAGWIVSPRLVLDEDERLSPVRNEKVFV